MFGQPCELETYPCQDSLLEVVESRVHTLPQAINMSFEFSQWSYCKVEAYTPPWTSRGTSMGYDRVWVTTEGHKKSPKFVYEVLCYITWL
jgi:hypothetical protein